MEKKQKQILREKYLIIKQLIVLDIPDEYQYMDPELVDMLKASIMPYVGALD